MILIATRRILEHALHLADSASDALVHGMAAAKNPVDKRDRWLDLAHKKLDEAVLDAYAWPHDLTDDEIIERLLFLNLKRARGTGTSEATNQTGDAA